MRILAVEFHSFVTPVLSNDPYSVVIRRSWLEYLYDHMAVDVRESEVVERRHIPVPHWPFVVIVHIVTKLEELRLKLEKCNVIEEEARELQAVVHQAWTISTYCYRHY